MLLKDLKKELDKIAVDPYFTLAHTLVESGYTEAQIWKKLCSKGLASIPVPYKVRLINFVRDIERR
jgi:hypothetical protein